MRWSQIFTGCGRPVLVERTVPSRSTNRALGIARDGSRPRLTYDSGGMVGVEAREIELPTGKRDSAVWLTLPDGRSELAALGPASAPQYVALRDGSHLVVFRADGL